MRQSEFDLIVDFLRDAGFQDNTNLADYWFSNREGLIQRMDGHLKVAAQSFELIARWQSAIGQACQDAVRNHILSAMELRVKTLNEHLKSVGGFEKADMSVLFANARINFDQ